MNIENDQIITSIQDRNNSEFRKITPICLLVHFLICIGLFTIYVVNSKPTTTTFRFLSDDTIINNTEEDLSNNNINISPIDDNITELEQSHNKFSLIQSLLSESFSGNWSSISNIDSFNNKKGSSQLVFRTYKNYKGKEGFFFNYFFYFFDGNYNNFSISFSNSIPFTFENENLLLYEIESEEDDDNKNYKLIKIVNNHLCSVQTMSQLNILNRKIMKSYTSFEYPAEQMEELNGELEIEGIKINFSLKNNSKFFYGNILVLCILLGSFGIYQIYIETQLLKLFEIDNREALKYSPYLFMINCIYNGGIGFESFIATLIDERMFKYFLIPTLLYFFIFCFLEPKLIIESMKVQINRQFNNNYMRGLIIRKKLLYFFILFYLILICLMFYSYDLFFWKTTMYLLIIATFIPQILFNIKSIRSPRISPLVILVITINKLSIPLFFRLQDNFLYFEPDSLFCLTSVVIIALEIIILAGQKLLSKSNFLRRFYNINRYNYYYTIKELIKAKHDLRSKICSICLMGFVKAKESKEINNSIVLSQDNKHNKDTLNISSIDKNDKNKEKVKLDMEEVVKEKKKFCCCIKNQFNEILMLTPCGHIFHSECLEQWLKVKSTCPDCRANLPNVY